MTKYQDLGTSLCSSIFILGNNVAEWCLKIVSVRVSLTPIHILGTNSMLYVGLTVTFTVLFFFQYFINKSKHGQNTLPLLGRIKIVKRIFTVLNIGIHIILKLVDFVFIIFFMKSELTLLLEMAYQG